MSVKINEEKPLLHEYRAQTSFVSHKSRVHDAEFKRNAGGV